MDSEILHGAEGGDVERWLEPRNKSFYLRLLYFSIYCYIIHFFFSINIHLNKITIEHLNSYLEESRGEVQSPSQKIWLQVLF